MPSSQGAPPTADRRRHARSGGKRHSRDRILHKQRPALVGAIAEAVVIKDEDVFFLCEPDGTVPLKGAHGFGLYYHDCRFLNGYEIQLASTRPNKLAATAHKGFEADLELTNSDLRAGHGKLIQKEALGIRWTRTIDAAQLALYDRFTVENYALETVEFPLSFRFGSKFEALFTVRGRPTKVRGDLHKPRWEDGKLVFVYDGADGIRRSLTVSFSETPQKTEGTTAHFTMRLDGRQSKPLLMTLALAESRDCDQVAPRRQPAPDIEKVRAKLHASFEAWIHSEPEVETDSPLFNRVFTRAVADLRVLLSELKGKKFFAAGVPWYVTLFGRDSILSSLQFLAYAPQVAEHTLRLLASYQGTKEDAWRDEEPGKIMHELRVGELAHTDRVPQTPYYGTIDATPLFLVLLCRHAAWTGALDVFHDLRDNVERALQWMARYGDPTGDGYLAYQVKSKQGLGNQGWKDSGDAIVNADGSLAKPPIALAEVQGYVYLAKTGLAGLYRRAGDDERANQLEREAAALKERFNRDFWLDDKGVFALALQAGKKPCAVVSSNAGQVLWSGIADPDKAAKTAQRLMADDMFSGWGIRTLSAQEARYNPIGYHLGKFFTNRTYIEKSCPGRDASPAAAVGSCVPSHASW
jgi:glycogen debranching enzyme